MKESKLTKLLKQDNAELAVSDNITVSLCLHRVSPAYVGAWFRRTHARYRNGSFGACASVTVRYMARFRHEIRL